MNTPQQALSQWLQDSVSSAQWEWFNEKRQGCANHFSERTLHITLGMIPRKLCKEGLTLTEKDKHLAEALLPGWHPWLWTVDAAARALIVHDLMQYRLNNIGELFADICRTADLSEQIALYQATALLPPTEALDTALGDGLRTSIQAVFEAIAHHNAYPSQSFDKHRWNHMVLKALFIDSTLHPIVGLDERANAELANILCDYAHERWAAHRPVTPELWRCVGPFAHTDAQINDLHRALADKATGSTEAALLALLQSPHRNALPAALRSTHAKRLKRIENGDISWTSVYLSIS